MWTVAGVLASFVMSGSAGIFKVVVALMFTLISLALFAKFAISPETQRQFFRIVAAMVAGTILIATTSIFAAAHRRGLIGARTIWTAAGLWAAGFAIAMIQWPEIVQPQWLGYLLAAAFFALAAAPLAAAPLAVAGNRHR
jgi:hypothetical protein